MTPAANTGDNTAFNMPMTGTMETRTRRRKYTSTIPIHAPGAS